MPELDERVAAIVRDQPEVAAAWLFGSRATGDGRPASDVDVAIVFAAGLSREARFRLRCVLGERIAAVAGVPTADVVDLEAAAPLLAHEVLRAGRLLSSRDDGRRVRVVARQLLRYLDTAPLRRRLDEATFRRLREGTLGRLR